MLGFVVDAVEESIYNLVIHGLSLIPFCSILFDIHVCPTYVIKQIVRLFSVSFFVRILVMPVLIVYPFSNKYENRSDISASLMIPPQHNDFSARAHNGSGQQGPGALNSLNGGV